MSKTDFSKLTVSKSKISKGERFFDAFRVMIADNEMPDPSPLQWEAIIEWVDGLEAKIKTHKEREQSLLYAMDSEKRAFKIAKAALLSKAIEDQPETYGINPNKLK